MKAMILAAGLGTRLRPLTNDRPKALVEIAGRTLLEITLARLRAFGITEVIVNAHHFADRVVDYLQKNGNFGMRIEISREDVLLDTGGGLKKAAWFFLEDSIQKNAPFILHNVDVVSTIDLGRIVQFHRENKGFWPRLPQRAGRLHAIFSSTIKWNSPGARLVVGKNRNGRAYPVRRMPTGWHFPASSVISPKPLTMMTENGAFSIIDSLTCGCLHWASEFWAFAPMSITGGTSEGLNICRRRKKI